ncbi:MAG: hypothetical protein A3F54_01725 [Candidatus Kerfeldbacteria bacterium RIFCSPHIGHO2_12_FULL_48_17]|uniref:2'-deoxycytidine 5'-triphosphate deaminase n=1 Tax=Candidatus Kerfeldbacteria bacterium RIFCSPHIGHO2_12_FULL_48_17 TaxID=1798542 RepID=A0A1G2B0K4_9BACT|nr:MAG: hypothetical protein A3F54_01725 [Candidatus Kerfeldbacteria bacterium RIFCSPHIGHO2_12_FULL_48_17]
MLGAYPSQLIEKLLREGAIHGADKAHVQPSSLDLTLSDDLYEIQGVMLPKHGETIVDVLRLAQAKKIFFDQPLACKKVYMCRLNEALELPPMIYAYANNKSSTGRINVQVRVLCDGVPRFDQIPKGYRGDLWIALSPQSFSVKLQPGEALNQMRFFSADTRLDVEEHQALYQAHSLLYHADGSPYPYNEVDFDDGGGITMTLDLSQDVVGFVAFPQPDKILDCSRRDHNPHDFFTPMYRPENKQLLLNRDGFYIFSTHEYISVPPEFSVEMIAYDPTKGEFRTHYAGFFDPGWGYGQKGEVHGTPAVLEVYPHDHNLIFRDGQPICKMRYERMATFPDRIYGVNDELRSHYHTQRGPKLSKYFTNPALQPTPPPAAPALAATFTSTLST